MKRGLGTMVGVMLISVVTIVTVVIFLSIYLRNIRDVSTNDQASCIGIDLQVNKCVLFLAGAQLSLNTLPLDDNVLYFVIERGSGKGEITDLRFMITDNNGQQHIERPSNFSIAGFSSNTNYREFIEYTTKEAVVNPFPLTYAPDTVTVAPVVGDSTVCEPIREPVNCILYGAAP